MTKEKEFCKACGAPMRAYRHPLACLSMIRVLEMMVEQHGMTAARPLDLPRLPKAWAQNSNYLKARYWGLLEPVGQRQGYHKATARAVLFLQNRLKLPATAVVYRNDVIGFDGESKYRKELVFRSQKKYDDYLNDAIPMGDDDNA